MAQYGGYPNSDLSYTNMPVNKLVSQLLTFSGLFDHLFSLTENYFNSLYFYNIYLINYQSWIENIDSQLSQERIRRQRFLRCQTLLLNIVYKGWLFEVLQPLILRRIIIILCNTNLIFLPISLQGQVSFHQKTNYVKHTNTDLSPTDWRSSFSQVSVMCLRNTTRLFVHKSRKHLSN
jgi:hypothetical protein